VKVNDFKMDDFKTIVVISVAKMECARPGRPDAPRVKPSYYKSLAFTIRGKQLWQNNLLVNHPLICRPDGIKNVLRI
jgi:hypothetical protein